MTLRVFSLPIKLDRNSVKSLSIEGFTEFFTISDVMVHIWFFTVDFMVDWGIRKKLSFQLGRAVGLSAKNGSNEKVGGEPQGGANCYWRTPLKFFVCSSLPSRYKIISI